MLRVLITGGAGRLGIRVCNALLENGYKVTIFDLHTPASIKNIKYLKQKPEIIWGDITNSESIEKGLNNIDVVVHMAAVLTAVIESRTELAFDVNVSGTANLIKMIKAKNVSIPLIYTSSVVVFGPTPDAVEPVSIRNTFPQPKGIYAETKLQAENIIKESGLNYVILRLASFWQDLISSKAELKYMYKIPLKNRIETCHPHDLATAIINSIRKFDTVKGKTLILSGGHNARILHEDRVRALMQLFGLPMPPATKFSIQPAPMDWYDTTESQNLLNFQTKTITDTVNDYKKMLGNKYSPLFLPLMNYIISPIFGKSISNNI